MVVLIAALAALSLPLSGGAAGSSPVITVHVTIHGHPETPSAPGIITFAPSHVKVGSVVTFKITNTDISPHNFQIDGHQTREMGGKHGQAIIRQLKFTTAGRYEGSCPDDNHSGIGGTFVVT